MKISELHFIMSLVKVKKSMKLQGPFDLKEKVNFQISQ